MPLLVDKAAKEIALTRYVLPECLHIPTAAVDANAIRSYVGEIESVIVPGEPAKAFVVRVDAPPEIDRRLPIFDLPESTSLHRTRQVWVHVNFHRYRQAYRKAFPEEAIDGLVLSHLLNRRIAASKGFSYIRIVPASRGCNSSSGFSENWGVDLHSASEAGLTLEQNQHKRRRGACIQYADLPDLMVMLNMKVGGGVMAAVNEGQRLVTPR